MYQPLKGAAGNSSPPQSNMRDDTAGRPYHCRSSSSNHLYLEEVMSFVRLIWYTVLPISSCSPTSTLSYSSSHFSLFLDFLLQCTYTQHSVNQSLPFLSILLCGAQHWLIKELTCIFFIFVFICVHIEQVLRLQYSLQWYEDAAYILWGMCYQPWFSWLNAKQWNIHFMGLK